VDSLPAAGSFPNGSFSTEVHNEAFFQRFFACQFRWMKRLSVLL